MAKHGPSKRPVFFEEAFVLGLRQMCEHMIAFNNVLGSKTTTMKPEQLAGRIPMPQFAKLGTIDLRVD